MLGHSFSCAPRLWTWAASANFVPPIDSYLAYIDLASLFTSPVSAQARGVASLALPACEACLAWLARLAGLTVPAVQSPSRTTVYIIGRRCRCVIGSVVHKHTDAELLSTLITYPPTIHIFSVAARACTP